MKKTLISFIIVLLIGTSFTACANQNPQIDFTSSEKELSISNMIKKITKLRYTMPETSFGLLSTIIDIFLYILIKISDTIHQTDYILQGTIVTMDNETGIIPSGNILIKNGLIASIWETNETCPLDVNIADYPIIETDGIIFPGLIDCHNHMNYNTIPIWNVTSMYTNRYQWQSEPNYVADLEYPKQILTKEEYSNLLIETMKYSETKALIGGTTSLQGANFGDIRYTTVLVRNIEHFNFGQDKVYTSVPSVETWDENTILRKYRFGNLEAHFGHIAEGTDELSHNEFNVLKNKGLLIEPFVGIHCVAFNQSNFDEMASVGAKVIWSPTSNLLLYGTTADVQTAWEEGVCVGLAPDWTPSGTKNVLGELKIADQWNEKKLNGFFTDYNLIEMVTTNPARICGWEDKVGKIKEGYHADLLVIDNWNDTLTPYRSLINAIDFDVKLVTVEGDPLYGLIDYFEVLKPNDYEILEFNGWSRALDITKKIVPKGNQLFSSINQTLCEVMTFDPEILYNYFDVGNMNLEEFIEWLDTEFPDGLHAVPLDPVYTYGDSAFFDAISSSENLNQNFSCDLSEYYNRVPDE